MALIESEAFNRGILSSLSSQIALINVEGQILATNDAWQKFSIENGETNLTRTGVGSNYFMVCKKAIENGDIIAEKVLNGVKRVIEGLEDRFEMEYPCHSPTEERWFLLSVSGFVSNKKNAVLRNIDITERKKSEKLILDSEARLKAAQTVAKLGDWEIDINSKSITWSDEMYSVFNCEKTQVDAIGGEITVESELNEGTAFSIILPVN